MTDIVSTSDIAAALGVTFTADETALANRLRLSVEAAVRNYVRWQITEETFTHFLPERVPSGRVLCLPRPWVSAVANVWEDYGSIGGQNSGVFDSETLLTVGQDYYVEKEAASDFSKEAVLYRYPGEWCPYLRSIKVQYTSGFTSAQLDAEAADISDAVIGETVERFKQAKARSGTTGDVGPILKERLRDYSVEYLNGISRATDRSSGGLPPSGLLPETELRLNSYMNLYDYF